ncbi:MAG: alpha/beta hydrolase [Ignavibacteria bacterium]|nr:alpha/beta hydrolase [Ignavibacteria bacterium]
MILPEENIVILNRHGREIHTTVTMPTDSETALVVFLHGFKGFRNWGFFPFAAQHLANAGFICVRIDMSLNGMRGTNTDVVDPDEFANNTISLELSDVGETIAAFLNQRAYAHVRKQWNNTLHFVGHSRGGAVAHVVARELLNRSDVLLSRCVVWNSVGKVMRWSDRQIKAWRDAGFMTVENTRTQQQLKINVSFLEDIIENHDRFSMLHAAHDLEHLMLYIHSETDLTVPLSEIQELLSLSGSKARLEVMPGSTHTFGMMHPVDYITPTFVRVMNLTTNHLKQ